MTRSLNYYPRGPQCGNSIELVEILFGTIALLHFPEKKEKSKRLAKQLSMLIYTGFEEINKNNIMKKYCIL